MYTFIVVFLRELCYICLVGLRFLWNITSCLEIDRADHVDVSLFVYALLPQPSNFSAALVGRLERRMFEEGNIDGDFGEWNFSHLQGSNEIVSFIPQSWTSDTSFESIWIIACEEKS